MPRNILGPCVRYKDKTYCFDAMSGQYVEVSVTPVSVKDCPTCVIQDIALLQAGELARFCNDKD